MIIKNPYNVIAKYYRLINFLILIPMIYLLLKFKDISGFYKDFVRAGYKTVETNFADTYVTTLTFIALGFMIFYNAFLYIVFTTKKKNGLFYGISAIAYIALLLSTLLFHGTMLGITGLDATFANFVRDMANLCVYPQYALIVITIVQALGFNIKTLRFEKKAALEVDEDEEEIEIQIGSDKNTIKKNAVHLIRELKYYALENKFVFKVFGIVLGIGIIIGLFFHFRNNKVYTYNEEVTASTFNIALKESYITNIDYRGNVIAKDTYFLTIKIRLVNNGYDQKIDTSVFRIEAGNDTLFPSYDRASRFVDIGKPYMGEAIKAGTEDDYVFVYELKPEQVKSTYKLKILNALEVKDGDINTSYKIINVKPQNITKLKDEGKVKIGKEINLKGTTLGETTFMIKSFKVLEYYTYNKPGCTTNKCKESVVPDPGYVLMKIEDEIKYDEKSSYYKNSYKDFYGDFCQLIIKPNDTEGKERPEYIAPMKEITPQDLKGKEKIYQVPIDALTAKKIDLRIKVRNIYYIVNLQT